MLFLFTLACNTSTKDADKEEEVIQDADADGFSVEEDCDDNNSLISPAAEEVCDGTDNNCDGQIDEGVQTDAMPTRSRWIRKSRFANKRL